MFGLVDCNGDFGGDAVLDEYGVGDLGRGESDE